MKTYILDLKMIVIVILLSFTINFFITVFTSNYLYKNTSNPSKIKNSDINIDYFNVDNLDYFFSTIDHKFTIQKQKKYVFFLDINLQPKNIFKNINQIFNISKKICLEHIKQNNICSIFMFKQGVNLQNIISEYKSNNQKTKTNISISENIQYLLKYTANNSNISITFFDSENKLHIIDEELFNTENTEINNNFSRKITDILYIDTVESFKKCEYYINIDNKITDFHHQLIENDISNLYLQNISSIFIDYKCRKNSCDSCNVTLNTYKKLTNNPKDNNRKLQLYKYNKKLNGNKNWQLLDPSKSLLQ